MSKRRQIPRESKTLKYFYIIKVKFRGEELIKLGISSNYVRRCLHQYRNENTNGFILDMYYVYKCTNVKNIESVVKWRLSPLYKAYKQEYFPMEFKEIVRKEALRAAKYFGYKIVPVDFTKELQEQKPEYKKPKGNYYI